MLQYIDEAGKRIAKDIEINEAELPRVLLAQQALIHREEAEMIVVAAARDVPDESEGMFYGSDYFIEWDDVY